MRTTFENRLGPLFVAALLAVIVVGYLSYRNMARLFLVNSRVAEANEVLAAIARTYSAIQRAQNQATEFAIIGDERSRTGCLASIAESQRQFDYLHTLIAHDPRQSEQLDRLAPEMANAFSIFQLVVDHSRGGKAGSAEAAELQVREEKSLEQIRRGIGSLDDEAHRVLEQRNAEAAADARSTIFIVVLRNVLALVVLLVVSGALYWDIARRVRAEKALTSSEQRYRTLFENAPVGIYRATPEGRILAGNPALVEMLGFPSFEELSRRDLSTSGFDPQHPRSEFIKKLEKGGEITGLECVWRKRGGEIIHVRENARAIRDEAGRTLYYEGTLEDITQRKFLEAQLQQSAKIEAVGRLAGGVAHDFNNLLTIINGYTDLLHERFAADEQASLHLKEIKNAGERAATLTRQLLAFSRRQVLAPQVLDLNEVVSSMEKMLERLIGEHIRLLTLLHPALGRVKADPGQIDQVIMNLVVNARDAMPMGGNLTIATNNVQLDAAFAQSHATVKPGPHVLLSVGDTGAGMSPETQARIFEPFFTTKELGKGTGLGLATVYGIVKQSEGSIWVESEPGKGTVFKIYLPSVSEAPAVRDRVKAGAGSAGGSETILVVEDEEGVLSLIRLALRSAGYQVLETRDPENALAICASHEGPVHLLLTDVVMPRMPGPAVAEKVTALRPDVKVLYMSGYTDDAIVHHGVLSAEMPFIQKPFSPIALRRKIREVLDAKP